MKLIIAAVALLAVSAYAAGNSWAVIVAGSNGYYNYRHQADACHAFQIVKNGGIAPERIIMMHFDDIANNPENPAKGKLFNKPTAKGTPGHDVYAGCQKDYTGNDVTADTFINVITGNSAGVKPGGKVLKSGPQDDVFIFFTDHGGTGIIAFPVGPYLQASRLNTALKSMFTKKMYNKLVFYMEACESGSMFEGLLPTNLNIYATTASNAEESSWGCYCPPDDVVNGVEFGSCLGDLYSVSWMEDTDSVGMKESLSDQFKTVKKLTTQSHVMQYGDLTWTNMSIGAFQGQPQAFPFVFPKAEASEAAKSSKVESRDIPMHSKYYKYLRTDKNDLTAAHAAAQELINEIQARVNADNTFLKLSKAISGDKHETVFKSTANAITNPTCLDAVNTAVFDHCGGYTDYSIRYSRVAANLCNFVNHDAQETQRIVNTLKSLCV